MRIKVHTMSQNWESTAKTVTGVSIQRLMSRLRLSLPNGGKCG